MRVKRFFVGITGASGHVYATRLIQALVRAGHAVDVSISASGEKVLRHECGVVLPELGSGADDGLAGWLGAETAAHVRRFAADAVEAPPSSGTALTGGVVLAPCSMGTLARVVAGFSSNLIERAADVALKEGRPLIVVPRETPLSEVHLENMLKLARLGGVVLPAMPGYYHRPRSIDDLVQHVVGKVLDRLGIAHEESARWNGELEPVPDPGTEPRGATPVEPADGAVRP